MVLATRSQRTATGSRAGTVQQNAIARAVFSSPLSVHPGLDFPTAVATREMRRSSPLGLCAQNTRKAGGKRWPARGYEQVLLASPMIIVFSPESTMKSIADASTASDVT